MLKLTTKNLVIGAVVALGSYLLYNKYQAMQAQKEAERLASMEKPKTK